MKNLKNEIRLYIAEKLIGWASIISPNTKEGNTLKKKVIEYYTGVFFKPK